MRETPRRHRADDEGRGGGGLPLFPLILVVILAGLLLGGVLGHFFGHANGPPKPAPTIAMVATPIPSQAPTATPSPAPTPSASAAPSKRPALTPKPASPTPSVTLRPKPPSLSTPTPHAVAPPMPHAAAPRTPTPAPTRALVASSEDRPSSIVRSYLQALARGDRATAQSYLARGAPNEPFMNGASQIESIRSESGEGGRYKVTADIRSGSGEYYATFELEPAPGGLQITQHYWIKPQ